MNIEELRDSGLIFFETIVGSHAYGTNTPESDVDKKGFFWVPPEEYATLNPPVKSDKSQISDEKNDNTFYSLYNAFQLLRTANPNMVELLWMPKDCIIYQDSVIMPELLENRDMFISKQAYHSHAEYARNQIKKARGKNKKVHNPWPKERPKREDFCYVIDEDIYRDGHAQYNYGNYMERFGFPFRPVPLKETVPKLDLSKCHAAAMENMSHTYRIYFYGDSAKGVFRGKDKSDQMLVCESIPKEDEWQKFIGLLIYNEDAYKKAVRDWGSYWEFMDNRNINRWTSQIEGKIDFDCKNMQHCFRLLYEGLNILTMGTPIVRFEGERLQFLKDIRNEKYTYAELMDKLPSLEARLDQAFKKCNLPEKSDPEKLDKLYRHIMSIGPKSFQSKV